MDSSFEVKTISHPIVLRYFETLNAEEFEQTSELFAIAGVLKPPFENPITGRAAIADYLEREAKGLVAEPRHASSQDMDDGCLEIQVTGRVKTPVFIVSVAWQFVLSAEDEILFARVKLIASPQELLSLRTRQD